MSAFVLSRVASSGSLVSVAVLSLLGSPAIAATVGGSVTESGGAALANARVTLATANFSFFREARTNGTGQYAIPGVPSGLYTLGASALGFEYEETVVTVGTPDLVRDFALGPDVHPGRWTVIGDTNPENLFASNSATLMPDGRIFYCHDTEEPVIFNPRTGAKTFPPSSPSQQGCHVATVLHDGKLIFIGGQDTDDFRDAVRTVKTYNPANSGWANLALMYEERWYPGLARLADGRLLVMGGGQRPNAQRTATCEIFNPATGLWARTDSMGTPAEYSSAVLLFTGDVLRSWYPPELYDVTTGQWRPTGLFVQPDRFYPGHSDHSMVLLADGRAMVCGIYRGALQSPSMVELYDPLTETWNLGATSTVTRSQTEVVLLPTGKVLCAGGKLEDNNPQVPTNEWGQTKLADLYDPVADSWQRVADMVYFREYHAVTVLVPDGRVVTTAGTGGPAQPGISNDVEAFEPPYLFRGVRPRIDSISTSDLQRGFPFTMAVSRTESVTSVMLIGTMAVTHWVDGGIPRLLSLPFTQSGSTLTVGMPSDPIVAPTGYYIVFALVDDIPSEGVIVRVLGTPTVSVNDAPPANLRLTMSPNPFVDRATVHWYQAAAGPSRFAIYGVDGRLVVARELDVPSMGWRRAFWDGRSADGAAVAAGVYWVHVEAAGETMARPLVRLR